MQGNRGSGTKPEVVLRRALWHAGLRGYRVAWRAAEGSPDIAFVGRRLAVFVHGCYWHRCPKCRLPLPKTNTDYWRRKFERNVTRDARQRQQLGEAGWTVLVFWECEVKADASSCAVRVAAKL